LKTGRSSKVDFRPPEAAFGLEQVLVAQRDVLGRQVGVGGDRGRR
jgi:hypothetical protein